MSKKGTRKEIALSLFKQVFEKITKTRWGFHFIGDDVFSETVTCVVYMVKEDVYFSDEGWYEWVWHRHCVACDEEDKGTCTCGRSFGWVKRSHCRALIGPHVLKTLTSHISFAIISNGSPTPILRSTPAFLSRTHSPYPIRFFFLFLRNQEYISLSNRERYNWIKSLNLYLYIFYYFLKNV